MTGATLTLREALDTPLETGEGLDAAPEGAARGRSGPTLDDLVTAAWDDLAADAVASCPVCGGRLEARFAAAGRAVAGRCADCHSELR